MEVHAEMHDGEIPDDVKASHEKLARELGLTAINQPVQLCGPGYTMRQQVLIMEQAVPIFGGRGYLRENVAERFWRELGVDRIWEGASEVQRAIIADQLRKRGTGIVG